MKQLIGKEELSNRLLSYYFETGRIPTLVVFKNNSSYRRVFGNWTKALEYCGLDISINKTMKHSNTWQRQKQRHLELKLELIQLLGGKCEVCGYNKNIGVLCFHHKDPKEKSISLDARSLGNRRWQSILEEAKKCQLLCSNCHLELHNPDLEGLL